MSDTQKVIYLDVEFLKGSQLIDVEMHGGGEQSFEVEMKGGSKGKLPYYNGPYEVDPRKVEQTLETEEKSMREDVVIKAIYYAETTNVGGGYTAVIGME